jgi:MarC family integral membrane protein
MLTRTLNSGQQWRAAVKVTLSILVILVASALIGLKVLSIFGISIDVFRIVGGMIIAYMELDMLSGRNLVGQGPVLLVTQDPLAAIRYALQQMSKGDERRRDVARSEFRAEWGQCGMFTDIGIM